MEDAEIEAIGDARLGKVLRDKYKLERVLGIGGMATVYAATHRNRRKFALKLLHPELSAHPEIRARFQREGYVANSVGHPGAVAVLDDDIAEDGSAFLVMELLEGTSIEELCQRQGGSLPPRAVCAIADQLLEVLASAHEAGIVHRDIKPGNLFLTRDGALKVLDFGIARLRDAASGNLTQTGAMMGTPAYMSPEQARGSKEELDAQADLWSAAATFFTLLSGRFVHDGENSQLLLVNLLTQPARSLASVASGVPNGVVRVIDRALQMDKSARFATARGMREALRQAEAEAYGAGSASLAQRSLAELVRSGIDRHGQAVESQITLSSSKARNARWAALSAGFVAGLLLLAALALFWFERGEGAARRAQPTTPPPALPAPASEIGRESAPNPAFVRHARADAAAPRGENTEGSARSQGVNPRAAPPVQRGPARPPAIESGFPKACVRMLEKQGIGELLTPEESAFVSRNCRQ